MYAEAFGDVAQLLISCPHERGRMDQDSGKEVCVDYTDSKTVQAASLDERANFIQLRHSHLWQEIEQCEGAATVAQRSQRKFRNDQWMDHNPAMTEMLPHLFDSGTQMINPNGRIGENQSFTLRRGTCLRSGMLLPRDANRRALSRSIRALRASRSRAVFSATPVNSWAMRRRSSSRATVVLILGTYYSII
jgi:hypothetical protein